MHSDMGHCVNMWSVQTKVTMTSLGSVVLEKHSCICGPSGNVTVHDCKTGGSWVQDVQNTVCYRCSFP
jgi:hypothetical protein